MQRDSRAQGLGRAGARWSDFTYRSWWSVRRRAWPSASLLSTRAPRTSGQGAPAEPGVVRVLRYFDLLVLAAALPVFLVAGLPLLGYAAAGLGWIVQRTVRGLVEQRVNASDDPRTVAGMMTVSLLGRAWLLALLVFGAGLIEREAGLAGAVLVIVLFTAFFSTQFALRPYDRAAPR